MTSDLTYWYAGQPVIIHEGTSEPLTNWFGGQPFVFHGNTSGGTTAKGIFINASGHKEETTTLSKVIAMTVNGFEEVNASGGGVKIITFGVNGLTEVTS